MKRNCGRSALSCKALAGQAPTQLMHSVQASRVSCSVPQGDAVIIHATPPTTLRVDRPLPPDEDEQPATPPTPQQPASEAKP
jgi:hypothetical protein